MGACVDELKEGVKDAVAAAADSMIGNVVEAFAEALGKAANSFMSWLNELWLEPKADGSQGSINAIQGELNWLVGYVAVASLLFAAVRMAVDRKGQSMQQAFQGMWRVILVSAIATAAVMALAKAADSYAVYIYHKPDTSDVGNLAVGSALVALAGTSPGLVVVFGLLAILAAFVQAILMILRIGVLVMLVGTLPLAAAASMTGWGGGWWKKHIGWLAAWLLFKPAAALVFFAGQIMLHGPDGEGQKEITQVVAGLGTLILATFALPALLKLVVPATAALGDTSGGSVSLNAANTVASGAVSIAGGGMGGGGGGTKGGSGAAGKSGPAGSPSSGGGSPSGTGGGAPSGGGSTGGGAGSAGGGAAAGGAAAAGVQAAAVAAQAATGAATEVTNSFADNDGNKGHNE